MGAERVYAAAAVLSGLAFVAAFAAGLFFSFAREGGLPVPDLDYMPQVRGLMEAEDYPGAVRELRSVALLEPTNEPALRLLAELAERTEDHGSRLLALRRLVADEVRDPGLRVALADALIAQVRAGEAPDREKQLGRAIWNAEFALREEPGLARAHRLIGEAWLLLGERGEAEHHFAEARRLEPGAAPTRPDAEQRS